MKRVQYIALLFVSLCSFAVNAEAQSNDKIMNILNRSAEAMTKRGAMELTFSHHLINEKGDTVERQTGMIRYEGEKFAFSVGNMKVWCDGKTRWNYLLDNNEIYISEPSNDFPQTLNPATLFKLEESGFSYAMENETETAALLRLTPPDTVQGLSRLLLGINKKTGLFTTLQILYASGDSSFLRLLTIKDRQHFDDDTYVCHTQNYDAEVIDMR